MIRVARRLAAVPPQAQHPLVPGRPLRRRDAMRLLAGGLGLLWHGARAERAAAAPTCHLSPEQTEGPFYVAGAPVRADVTEGRSGVPLGLRLRVHDATRCRRVVGATVEIWHADAAGEYSGVDGAGTTFLRGQQPTDAGGRVAFTTIYPGWYPGRTPHVHVKVHVAGNVVHTGQLYFKDAASNAVYTRAPYAVRGPRDTTNAGDAIYASGGAASMLALWRARAGYVGRMILVVRA